MAGEGVFPAEGRSPRRGGFGSLDRPEEEDVAGKRFTPFHTTDSIPISGNLDQESKALSPSVEKKGKAYQLIIA